MALTIDTSYSASVAALSLQASPRNTAALKPEQPPLDASLDFSGDYDLVPSAPQTSVSGGIRETDVIIVMLSQTQAASASSVKNGTGKASAENIAQLQNALQKSGIGAEIEYKPNGQFIFRYVDERTHRVEFQIPSEVVDAIVENMNVSSNSRSANIRGSLIDQRV